MCDFINKNIRNYVASRDDIPDKIKETVKTNAIEAYMKKAQYNPDDFADKSLRVIVYEIMEEIKKVYPEIKQNTNAAAGGSRRRRSRHRRSTRTSKKGKKYSTTRRRK